MADKTIEYKIIIDDANSAKTLSQLEDSAERLNAELKDLDPRSEDFKNLAKAAQGVNKEIEIIGNSINGLKFEDKIQAFDGGMKILAGSTQSVVGGFGLLGIESEKLKFLEEQATNAIAFGLGLKDLSEGLGQVSIALKKAGIGADLFGKVTKKALLATGILAFVVVLGTVIAYWDEITAAVQKFGEKVPFVGKALDGIKNAFNSIVEAARPVLEFLGLMPTEAEAAAAAIKKAAEASIGPLEQELALMKARKATQEEIFEQEKKLLQARIDGAKTEEEAQKARNQLAVLIAADMTRRAEEEEARNKEAAEKAKERLEQRKADEKEALEERKANEKEATDFLKSLKDEELDLLTTTDEQKLELQQSRLLAEIEQLKVSEAEKNTIRLQAEENYNLQLQQLKDTQDIENKEKEKTRLAELNDFMQQLRLDNIDNIFLLASEELAIGEQKDLEELERLGATDAQKTKVAEFYSKKRKQLEEEEVNFKKGLQEQAFFATLQVASQVFSSISSLSKEGSKAAKIASIAQATIDTLASAVAAYKSTVGIPFVGPVLAPIAAAAALAAGYATVKKIKSTQVPGGGGNVGGSTAIPTIPRGPAVPSTTTSNAVDQIDVAEAAFQNQNSIRAYVVSGDVRSSQEANAKIQSRRTLAS
jgi:hypothetical protein